MFKITAGKGFQVTFANGNTVSVQWGYGNYCDHHFGTVDGDFETQQRLYGERGSHTAEIAGLDADGEWLHPDSWGDDVKGYCTPEEVLEFMNWIAAK